MKLYINGRCIQLSERDAIGKGSEADIYRVPDGMAVKVFKQPDHADLAGNPAAQDAARERIVEHQRKLPVFPHALPDRVVAPAGLATTKKAGGEIAGYAMKLVEPAERLKLCRPAREAAVRLLRDLRRTVEQLHRRNVVIGDFTPLNILAQGDQAFLIDADSFQFGPFFCRMFTEPYVDPLLCDPDAPRPILVAAHNPASDWFAYAVIVMEVLLGITPYYGGVYKGAVPHCTRPLKRITVFRPEVVYPKQALHFSVLPDALLHYFAESFERDCRVPLGENLLDILEWKTCACGITYARPVCPKCGSRPAGASVPAAVVLRGNLRVETVFRTTGVLLNAAVQKGRLLAAYAENGRAYVLSAGARSELAGYRPGTQIHFFRGEPILACAGSARFPDGRREIVDAIGGAPQIAAAGEDACWLNNGVLWRYDARAPRMIGEVLRRQTRLWLGEQMGLAYYHAGGIRGSFLFFAGRAGCVACDGAILGAGDIVEMHAVFSGTAAAWIFLTVKEGARLLYRLVVLDARGKRIHREETDAAGAHWLSGYRGACAGPAALFVPTNEGVVRVSLNDFAPAAFPQTAEFVSPESRLLLFPQGIYALDSQCILELRLN